MGGVFVSDEFVWESTVAAMGLSPDAVREVMENAREQAIVEGVDKWVGAAVSLDSIVWKRVVITWPWPPEVPRETSYEEYREAVARQEERDRRKFMGGEE